MTQPSQPLYTYWSKDAGTIRDDILRTEKNGLIALGIANPNVGPGSDYYTRATAVGNELAVIHANNVLAADAGMPDTAAGADLDRWLANVGLSRRPAIGSHGNISAPCSASSTAVPNGYQLTDQNGARYQVLAGGTYAATGGYLTVPLLAIDTGAATNHENGDALQWTTAPPFCAQQVVVGAIGGEDGLTGGFDSEVGQDEPPRARLLARLQNPPRAGNAADVADWATESTPSVQAGFVYPALISPGVTAVCVVGQAQTLAPLSATSKNRDLPSALINGTVAPYIAGLMPERTMLCVTSAANQATDLSILLSLPPAPTASPPGPGGGWLDGTPWPQSLGGTAPVTVTSAASSTNITVNAVTAPLAGVSHIAWVSPLTWQLYTATVLSWTGTSGAYVLTLDTPLVGVGTGNHIFPQATNQTAYLAAVFAAFGGLGPGEWLASPGTRAYRHPPQTLSWPYALDARFLKQVINSGSEVEDANWIYREATAPTVPSLPVVINSSGLLSSAPPNVLTPNNLSWYAA